MEAEPVAFPRIAVEPVLPPTPAWPSFHHPVALRVGIFAASLATLLCLLLAIGFVIWLPAAGFLSVYLFSRRTGQLLSLRAGARMGWITGILSFVIITVLFTISILSIGNHPGGLAAYYREQATTVQMNDKNVEHAIEMLERPSGQALLYFTFLFLMFGVVTVFCVAGGAVGAKVLEKE
ncbi:MAG: hypothetical protein ABIZ80_00555 [Bryobacteraceae bacterium]